MALSKPASERTSYLVELSNVTSTDEILGKGAYGRVLVVTYRGRKCAAKEVHPILLEGVTPEEFDATKKSFLTECDIMSRLHHPNVVKVLGIHYPNRKAKLPWLVMEMMKTSLKDYLEKHDKDKISIQMKLSILVDTSQGLEFIHGQDIIHRDLSSNNVLLTKESVAKIADLGVAKVIEHRNRMKTQTQTPGTLYFMPPEALSVKPRYGKPVDVFSLGCIACHVMSHQWPEPKDRVLELEDSLVALTEIQRREEYIKSCTELSLRQLVELCLHNKPERRPEISSVCQSLKLIKASVGEQAAIASGICMFDLVQNKKLQVESFDNSVNKPQEVSGLSSASSPHVRQQEDKSYNLLLIGQTGSGKTSFLNLLCNSDMVKKLGFEPVLENFHHFNDIMVENVYKRGMESKTSRTTLYNITVNDLEIGIIDTPGFGDSRGFDEDKRRIKTIVDALKEIDHVNCVCLVINGRLARVTATIHYVLTEITAILPRNVLDNVIIVFTNTSDELELLFDVESLKRYFGKNIEKYFIIENPYCRFEKVKAKQGKIANKLTVEALKKMFDEAFRELSKMLEVIKYFKAVHTHHFTTLYEKKQQIECQVLKTVVAYDSKVELSQHLKKVQFEIEVAQHKKRMYKDFLTYTAVTRWNSVSTPHHNTLCGAPGCYRVCHEGCSCLGKSFSAEILKRCSGIGGATCKTCGHDYRSHYHNEVKMVKETKSVPLINDEMREKFEEADSTDKMAAIVKSDIESRISASEEKKKTLSHNLLLIMEEFHKLGLNKNYANILEAHLFTIPQRKEASDNQEDIVNLTKTEEEIKKKLDFVRTTLNEPWSPKADPEAQRDWACKMLELDPSSKFGIDEVDKAFKALVLVNHPDKQGNPEVTKKLKRAREILKQE